MKRIFWSIADNNNIKYFEMMKNSFKKFNPNEELILFDQNAVMATGDKDIFYRATPYFTKRLMEQGYDEVCKLDADQIITSNLDHIFEGDFDLAGVFNSNPREDKVNPIRLWDINPFSYLNCGFVVMRSKEFVDHWLNLCMSDHFGNYQYREQDLLNIMVFYGNYKIKFLDQGSKWHGLISKSYWSQIIKGIAEGKNHIAEEILLLPKNEEWPIDETKQIVCLHWAGGNQPNKMTDLNIRFSPEVAKYLQELIKP